MTNVKRCEKLILLCITLRLSHPPPLEKFGQASIRFSEIDFVEKPVKFSKDDAKCADLLEFLQSNIIGTLAYPEKIGQLQ